MLATVPQRQKEAVLPLGGPSLGDAPDRDRTALHPRHLRSDDPGLGRALGEIDGAVTMVIGNRPEALLSRRSSQPGYSMARSSPTSSPRPSGTSTSPPLVLIGLILFAMTLAVNLAAKGILTKMVARASRDLMCPHS